MTSSDTSPNALDAAAGFVSRLAHRGLPAAEFYQQFLDVLPTPVGTLGAVAWGCEEDAFTKIAAGTKSLNDSVQLPVSAAEHAAQLDQVRRTREPHVFEPPPQDGYQVMVENAIPFIAVFPIAVGEVVPVVVEAYLPPDLPEDRLRIFLRHAQLLCGLAANFHQASPAPAGGGGLTLGASVHETLRVQDTCFAIANEGRRCTQADRVSVLTTHGGRSYRVRAVSGQEAVNPRANLIQSVERLVVRVLRTSEPFWYPRDAHQLPPEFEHELEAYLEVSHARRLGILPLMVAPEELEVEADEHAPQRRGDLLGALVVEQFTDAGADDSGLATRTQAITSEASIALRNAVDHESIFLLPLWRWVGGLTRYFRGGLLPKTLLGAAAALALVLALIFVPMELKVACDGKLMPSVRRNLYAPMDGIVDHLSVEHGDAVVAGQVLLTMRNRDLELQRERNRGEMRTAQAQLDAILAERLAASRNAPQEEAERMAAAAKEEELRITLSGLQAARALLEEQQALLEVASPISGDVITWDLRDRLTGRPLLGGQRLLQVADLKGDWQLELRLPDRRVADVLAAQEAQEGPLTVTYVLATDTSRSFTGTITEIEKLTRSDEDHGQSVLVRVAIDKEEPLLQPGAEIQAKIHCGPHKMGYVWLRDVWHFLRAKVVFPLT